MQVFRDNLVLRTDLHQFGKLIQRYRATDVEVDQRRAGGVLAKPVLAKRPVPLYALPLSEQLATPYIVHRDRSQHEEGTFLNILAIAIGGRNRAEPFPLYPPVEWPDEFPLVTNVILGSHDHETLESTKSRVAIPAFVDKFEDLLPL